MKFGKNFKCVAAAALFAVLVASLVMSGCSGVFEKIDPPGVSSSLGVGVSSHIKSVLGSGGGVLDFQKYESAVATDPSIVKPSITNGGKDLVMEALRPGKCDVTLIVRLTNGQTAVYTIEVEVDDGCNAKFELPKVPVMSYSYDVAAKVKEKINPESGEEISRVTGVFLPTDKNTSFISAASFSGTTATFAGNSKGEAGSTDADIMVVLKNGKGALYRVAVQSSNNGTVEVTDGDVLYRSDTFDFAKYSKITTVLT